MELKIKIKNLLDQSGVEYEESHHEPVFTSEEAAKVRKSNLHEGAKALIFYADNKPIQIVIQGDKRVDKDKFKKQFGFTKLKMVSVEDVKKISGVEPGAVAPFGNLFDHPIPVYCTQEILDNDRIEFNAGDHRVSIKMNPKDWQKLAKPIVGNYSEK